MTKKRPKGPEVLLGLFPSFTPSMPQKLFTGGRAVHSKPSYLAHLKSFALCEAANALYRIMSFSTNTGETQMLWYALCDMSV